LPTNTDLATLIGNGLSIAFSDKLLLGNISQEVIERLTSIYKDLSDDVAQAMLKAAAHARTGDPTNDFEALIGAFGGQSDILDDLGTFAQLTEDSTAMAEAISQVRQFVGAVQRRGIGHTLEIIVERSRSDFDSRKPIEDFFSLIAKHFTNGITVANLNYDTLVLSVLSEDYRSQFCDMAHGAESTSISLTGNPHSSWPLRPNAGDFPEQSWKRIRLLHLHGSVTFWSVGGSYIKVGIETARNSVVWQRYRDGELTARPLVVLANQHDKADHVKRYPFKLAYDVAETDFRNARQWLIVGYSFRDACVNDLLQRCWEMQVQKPKILIVTKGDGPTDEDVEFAFGWESETFSDHDVTIERAGLVGLGETSAWASFAGV
jgi:hypothetical protein